MSIDDLIKELEYKPFPYINITLDEIKKEADKLDNIDIIEQKKCKNLNFTGGFKYKKGLFMIKSSSVGNKISNYFFQRERMKAKVASFKSPIEIWRDPTKRERLVKSMVKLNKHKMEINLATMRNAFRLYYSVASQFKVPTAKAVFEHFDAKDVLDFSAGWGDRLTAFMSCKTTKSYTGIDPNKNLEKCFKNLIYFYNSDKKVKMIYKPAENVKLEKKFDLIFTSPPYFELEKYSSDKNQSNIKYDTLEIWLEEFLFKTIKNFTKNLKKNGHLVLQISNYKKNGKTINLVEPLLKYIKKETPELEYQGFIAISSKARFSKDDIHEPIFVWKKITSS